MTRLDFDPVQLRAKHANGNSIRKIRGSARVFFFHIENLCQRYVAQFFAFWWDGNYPVLVTPRDIRSSAKSPFIARNQRRQLRRIIWKSKATWREEEKKHHQNPAFHLNPLNTVYRCPWKIHRLQEETKNPASFGKRGLNNKSITPSMGVWL